MPAKDFIPQNSSAFAVWFANFIVQLQALATKYGVDAAKVAQLMSDNLWVQYWVEARASAKQQERQIGNFYTEIVRGELGSPAPTQPVWALPGSAPHDVPTGICKRIRETANVIKSQKSIYTRADGELLGIVTPEEAGLVETDFAPDVKFKAQPDYRLEADFRKFGLDAVRFEFRYKGGEWQFAGFLTKTPGVLTIPPRTAGAAEQVELRAVFWDENKSFGNWSPIYTMTVAP